MGPPSSSWESWWAFWLPRHTTAAASSYSIPLPPTLLFLKDSPGLSQMKGSNSWKCFLVSRKPHWTVPGWHCPYPLHVPFLTQERKSNFYGSAKHLLCSQDLSSEVWEMENCQQQLTAAVRGALWSPPIPLLKRPYFGCLSAVGKLKASSSAATGCPDQTWWYSCLLPHSFFPGYLEPTLLMYYLLFSIRTGIFHIYFP